MKTRRIRRAFLWRVPLQQWPWRARLAGVVLLILAAVVVILGLELLPSLTNLTNSDRWAAEGVLFASAAFVFAVIGTAIAVLAWINANERPRLVLDARYVGDPRPLPFDDPFGYPRSHFTPQATVRPTTGTTDEGVYFAAVDPMPLEIGWSLTARVQNDGRVGARFVAVLVSFENCWLSDTVPPDVGWHETQVGSMEWSGGSDVVIHGYGFSHSLPTLRGTLRLTPDVGGQMVVSIVADDFRERTVLPLAVWGPDGRARGEGQAHPQAKDGESAGG